MKKLFSILIALILTVTLVACNDTKKPKELTDKDILEAAVRSVQWNGLTSEEKDKVTLDLNLSSESVQSGKKVAIKWTSQTSSVVISEKTSKDVLVVTGVLESSLTENLPGKITATFTYNNETDTKTFEFTVLQRPVLTVAGFLALKTTGSPAAVTGIVTGMNGNNQYTFEDSTGAVTVYTSTKLVIGTEYQLGIARGAFSGLEQGTNVKIIKTNGVKDIPEAINLDEDFAKSDFKLADLKKYQARLISLTNVKVKTIEIDSYKNVSITFTKGKTDIKFKWDSRVSLPNKTDSDLISGLKIGDEVNIVGAPLGWSSAPLIGFSNVNQIVKVTK